MRMVQPSLDFGDALAARDAGMAQGAARAEREKPGWGETAFANIVALCRSGALATPMLAEDIRARAYIAGLTPPPDDRHWGPVFRKAIKVRLIVHTGCFAAAKSSHLGQKPLWVAAS